MLYAVSFSHSPPECRCITSGGCQRILNARSDPKRRHGLIFWIPIFRSFQFVLQSSCKLVARLRKKPRETCHEYMNFGKMM